MTHLARGEAERPVIDLATNGRAAHEAALTATRRTDLKHGANAAYVPGTPALANGQEPLTPALWGGLLRIGDDLDDVRKSDRPSRKASWLRRAGGDVENVAIRVFKPDRLGIAR